MVDRLDAFAFLAERPIGVLATTGPDGSPHAVPVEVIVDGEHVYCWCESDSVKVANVERDRRAALVAYKGNDFVLVRGPARVLRDSEGDYVALAQHFLAKYRRTESYGNDVLVEITAERVSARIGS